MTDASSLPHDASLWDRARQTATARGLDFDVLLKQAADAYVGPETALAQAATQALDPVLADLDEPGRPVRTS